MRVKTGVEDGRDMRVAMATGFKTASATASGTADVDDQSVSGNLCQIYQEPVVVRVQCTACTMTYLGCLLATQVSFFNVTV